MKNLLTKAAKLLIEFNQNINEKTQIRDLTSFEEKKQQEIRDLMQEIRESGIEDSELI